MISPFGESFRFLQLRRKIEINLNFERWPRQDSRVATEACAIFDGGQIVGQERRRHVRHWRRPHVHGGVAVEARARRRQGRGPRLRDEAPTRVDRGGARARPKGAGDVGNDRRLCELSEQSRSRGARRSGRGAQGADEPRALVD